jgi:DNA-directed RNA polymerase
MADKKFKYVPFVTEVMTARYPKLSEPDTKGEYADGKYKTEATADEAYTETFQEAIQAVADEYFAGKKNVHLPWKETKEGAIAFNFKSPKKKPMLTDSKGKPLKQGTVVRGGSLIRIAGVIAAWEKGAKRGVSLWPDAVRVLKLSEGFDANAAFGAAEDGFDADEYEPTAFGDEEGTDETADTSGDDEAPAGDDAFKL